MIRFGTVFLVVMAGCKGGGDSDSGTPTPDACTNGLPNGSVMVDLTGGFAQSDMFGIACGIDTEDPWQVTSQVIPDGAGVPPYIELRFQNDTAWAFSARFATELETGTSDVIVRGAEEPGPPLGHGWFAAPVETAGYRWTLTGGTLTLDAVEDPGADLASIRLLSGSAQLTFGADDADDPVTASVTLTDFPVTQP